MLDSGDWDPEIIVAKLPDFFRFVKKVQGFVSREMKETGLERTSKQKSLIKLINHQRHPGLINVLLLYVNGYIYRL